MSAAAALHGALNSGEVFQSLLVIGELARELGMRGNGDEVVPQLMPHADGHLADGGEALELAHPLARARGAVDEGAHIE